MSALCLFLLLPPCRSLPNNKALSLFTLISISLLSFPFVAIWATASFFSSADLLFGWNQSQGSGLQRLLLDYEALWIRSKCYSIQWLLPLKKKNPNCFSYFTECSRYPKVYNRVTKYSVLKHKNHPKITHLLIDITCCVEY